MQTKLIPDLAVQMRMTPAQLQDYLQAAPAAERKRRAAPRGRLAHQ